MQKDLVIRIILVAALILLLMLPLGMIGGIVGERQSYQAAVEQAVADSAAHAQRLAGPLLVVPYVEREIITSTDERGRETRRHIDHSRQVFFVAESTEWQGQADIETRYKGIYKALVYRSSGRLAARFVVPQNLGLSADPRLVTQGDAFLAFGLTDVRGLVRAPKVFVNGRDLAVASGSGFEGLGNGFHVPVGRLGQDTSTLEVEADMAIAGTRSLSFVPIAKANRVALQSAWPHPGFSGSFLPVSREVSAAGFKARWEVSHLASKNVGLLMNGLTHNERERKLLEAFDICFVDPVSIYQQSERALKYGVLFIGLTFAAFFVFETLKGLRIHLLQYGMVGLALTVFFLLLVSLTEHIPFAAAYVLAAFACVALIAYYLAHILGSWRRGLAFGINLAGLYAALYALLQSEDHALLLGSVLLFGLLAALMVATRRMDWYRIGAGRTQTQEAPSHAAAETV